MEPTWRIPEQFVVHELQNVFLLDVYRSSHPISVEVNHPNEIDEIFDTISYGKGERKRSVFLADSGFCQLLIYSWSLKLK